MPNQSLPHEARLNVRLSGPLADHVNRQVESELYSSHSEYIRDLIRRDMTQGDADLLASVKRGLADIEHGHTHAFDADALRKQAKAELSKQG